MDYNAFAKKIHRENKKKYNVICMLFCFALFAIVLIEDKERGYFFLPLLTAVITWDFFKSYMVISSGLKTVAADTDIADLAQVHGIDSHKYFRMIFWKMLPVMLFMAVCEGLGFFLMDGGKWHVAFGILHVVLCFLVPTVTAFFLKKLYEYDSCHGAGVTALSVLRAVVVALLACGKVFFYILCGIFFLIFGASLWSAGNLKELQDVVACQSFQYSAVGVMLLLFALFPFSFFLPAVLPQIKAGTKKERLWDRKEPEKWQKGLNAVRGILFVAIVGTMFLNAYLEKNYNTLFTEATITVCEGGKKREYRYEEVVSYQIYEKDDMLKMRFAMTDGTEVEVFGKVAVYSEEYVRTIRGPFCYAAYLAKKLEGFGIKGEIRDIPALSALAGEDEESREALQKLIEKLGKADFYSCISFS